MYTFRNYQNPILYSKDYESVRNFLIQENRSYFHFGRFDWMMSHALLNPSDLSKIGIWEKHQKIIGLTLFDCVLGEAFLIHSENNDDLLKAMVTQAENQLSGEHKLRICVSTQDQSLIQVMQALGYQESEEAEVELRFELKNQEFAYHLPEGFRLDSMDQNFDVYHYGEVLWKGFNHEQNGEGAFVWNADIEKSYVQDFDRPNIDLSLKIMALNDKKEFVSYVGFFADPNCDTALLEPLATDPSYRRCGLAKAVVYEGMNRLKARGIAYVLVGSNQDFYHAIGFKPYHQSKWWTKKEKV
jgi:predicted N-acetyltransferase YhbS